jgi:hypothetical protein
MFRTIKEAEDHLRAALGFPVTLRGKEPITQSIEPPITHSIKPSSEENDN